MAVRRHPDQRRADRDLAVQMDGLGGLRRENLRKTVLIGVLMIERDTGPRIVEAQDQLAGYTVGFGEDRA